MDRRCPLSERDDQMQVCSAWRRIEHKPRRTRRAACVDWAIYLLPSSLQAGALPDSHELLPQVSQGVRCFIIGIEVSLGAIRSEPAIILAGARSERASLHIGGSADPRAAGRRFRHSSRMISACRQRETVP